MEYEYAEIYNIQPFGLLNDEKKKWLNKYETRQKFQVVLKTKLIGILQTYSFLHNMFTN